MRFGIFTIIACLLASQSYGRLYIGVAGETTQDDMDCLVKNNVNSVLIPIWIEGKLSPFVAESVSQAQVAGIKNIQLVYVLAPNQPGNYPPQVPITQITSAIRNLKLDSAVVWTVLLNYQSYWYQDESKNQDYADTIVNLLWASTPSITVQALTEQNFWNQVMGQDFVSDYLSQCGLTYVGTNNHTSFDDFTAFGGWTQPFGKGLVPGLSLCSLPSNTVWTQESADI